MKAKLGKRYQDNVTGFLGTATGRTEYLNGCVRVCLTGDATPGVEPVDYWVDEQQLDGITSSASSGGPRPAPPRRNP